jgi:hypothetical protein
MGLVLLVVLVVLVVPVVLVVCSSPSSSDSNIIHVNLPYKTQVCRLSFPKIRIVHMDNILHALSALEMQLPPAPRVAAAHIGTKA